MGKFIHPSEQFGTKQTDERNPAEKFRTIAASIRNNPLDRDAIAAGFDLIAASIEEAQALVDEALGECKECGQPEPVDAPALPVIDPADLPDLGADVPTLGTDSPMIPASIAGLVNTTSQAE